MQFKLGSPEHPKEYYRLFEEKYEARRNLKRMEVREVVKRYPEDIGPGTQFLREIIDKLQNSKSKKYHVSNLKRQFRYVKDTDTIWYTETMIKPLWFGSSFDEYNPTLFNLMTAIGCPCNDCYSMLFFEYFIRTGDIPTISKDEIDSILLIQDIVYNSLLEELSTQ